MLENNSFQVLLTEKLESRQQKVETRNSVDSSKYVNKFDLVDAGDADDDDVDYIPRKNRSKVCFIT